MQPFTPDPLPSLDHLGFGLTTLCDELLSTAGVPGASVAVVAGDRGHHYAYGVKSVNAREPVTADTAFDIGSCAKAFTSAAVACLAADGLLHWDDPISRYVSEFQLYDPRITAHATLRDLSANRLGLPRLGLTEFGLDPQIDATYIFEHLRYTAPIHPFRDRFTYVNAGHAANAVAVGSVDGAGFLTALRRRLLEPLGMRQTSSGRAARTELADQASWHVLDNDGRAHVIPAVFTDQYAGSGAMVVSGRDAIQWLRLHLNGGQIDGRQIVPREALLETHHPHVPIWPAAGTPSFGAGEMESYALGWAVTQLQGHPLLAHSGSDYGVASFTLLAPRDGIGIAVYANALTYAARNTAYALLRRLLGLQEPPAPVHEAASCASSAHIDEPTTPALPLSAYAGQYRHPADGLMHVVVGPKGLRGSFALGHQMEFTLTPRGVHRFALQLTALHWRGFSADLRPELVFDVEQNQVVRVSFVTPGGQRWFERED